MSVSQGGTLDATAHEILHDGNIKEIHKVTGGPHGGTKVDEQFVTLLGKVFGISVVEDFRMNYPAGWLKMMNDFEMKKRGKRASAGDTTRIVLPRDFITLVSNAGGLDLSGKFANSCSLHDVKILNNEYLCLGSGAMKQLFQPVVNSIVGHLKELMQSPVLQGVNFFFLVGGFAESVILQEAIKKEFSAKFRILLPLYASAAVMQGAVMFGQKPHIIDSRIMATTYGFDIYRHFDPNLHPIEKKHVIDDVTYCKDCFEVLAKENDVVKVGETKRFPYRILTGQQASARINLFTSKNPEVKYTTDTAVGPSVGKVEVDSPDTWKGINRRIDVCALFGGTEIKVTAVDLTSGNSATTYLDFLSRS